MKSMLRAAAISALLALGAAPALAQAPTPTWTDPTGAFTISNPEKWKMEKMSDAASQVTQYFGGAASHECWVSHIPRADSADKSVAAVKKAFSQPIGDAMWAQVFPNLGAAGAPPKVLSASVDTNAGWPVQLATLEGKDGTTIAAIHGRPGFEVRTWCVSFDKKDRAAAFTQIVKSVTSPKDADWNASEAAAAEAAKKAEADAAAAAAAAAAPKAKGKEKPKDRKKKPNEG
jgi:hypothetical protein